MTDLEPSIEEVPKTTKKYFPELDCIRGAAIFFLLCLHTDVGAYMDIGIFPELFFQTIIASLAVPVFFCLSGIGLTLRYRNQELDIKEFYKTRYKNLVPPYIIWTFLIFTTITIGETALASESILSLNNFLDSGFLANFFINYLIGIVTGNVYTLWFVFVLLMYYFLFPFILKLFKKSSFRFRQIIIIIAIVLTYLAYLINVFWFSVFFIGDKGLIYQYSSSAIQFDVDIGNIYRAIPFFYTFLLGIDIGFNYEGLKKILRENLFIKVSFIISAFFFFIFLQVADLVYAIEFFAAPKYVLLQLSSIFLLLVIFNQNYDWKKIVSKERIMYLNNLPENNSDIEIKANKLNNLKNKSAKFLWFTGQNSTGIYFTHRIVMAVVWVILYFTLGITLWKAFGPEISRLYAFLYVSLSLILIYIGSIILIKVIRKLPKNEYILAKPRS
ncbi:MAG: acyltransferase family protein [Promethearchaeota archaeon]